MDVATAAQTPVPRIVRPLGASRRRGCRTTPTVWRRMTGSTRDVTSGRRMASRIRCCASHAPGVTTLVSFDVDGTLVESVASTASKVHRDAFAHCFREHFDLDTDIDAIQHQGSTDPLIILAIVAKHGLDAAKAMEQMPVLMQSMVDHFQKHEEAAAAGLRVLPGAASLLTELKGRGDVATCLVTGNLQEIGWGKMRALGLKDLFTPSPFGGFGSDFCSGNFAESWRDRSELIRIAGRKGRALVGDGIVQAYHVGDAPMDMMAAKAAGVTGIGVTTGIYPREVLIQAGAAVVLEGLEDVAAVLSVLNLA